MIKYNLPILFILFNMWINSALAQNLQVQLITDPYISTDGQLSVIAFVRHSNYSQNYLTSETFQLSCENGSLTNESLAIKNGAGSLTTQVETNNEITLSLMGMSGSRTLQQLNKPEKWVSSNIVNSQSWSSDTLYHVQGEISVMEGAELIVEAGTVIRFNPGANLHVYGNFEAIGIPNLPIVFSASDPSQPWGGIKLLPGADTARLHYCIFRYGGGNADEAFGHSDSQPVIYVEETGADIQHCFIMDNPGKALGTSTAQIKMEKCLISRCDTGGEYWFSHVFVLNCWYIDIPNSSQAIEDDDNDACYFYNIHPEVTQASMVVHTFFDHGDDDAIDHNDAYLFVYDCFINDFAHEGIAASGDKSVLVVNTLIKNCDQGIEAGYGNPYVVVEHCVLINNNTGLRFGDSYDWGCSGLIAAGNSIMYNNADNILNYDLLTQGPVAGAINVDFSMTNDPEFDGQGGCFAGTPLFDERYMLLPGSDGIGMASNGSDVGLKNDILYITNMPAQHFKVWTYPNPTHSKLTIEINNNILDALDIQLINAAGDLLQNMILDIDREGQQVEIDLSNEPGGIYFLRIAKDDQMFHLEKIIKH